MNLLSIIPNLLGRIIEPIAGYQNKKKEKEIIKIQAQSKLELAKQAGKTNITLKDAEWEAISVSKKDSTWIDEFMSVSIMAPLLSILAGSLLVAFGGSPALLNGTLEGIKELSKLGVDFGTLMTIVVTAGVGIKATRTLRK